MKNQFIQIEEAFKALDREMLRKGQLPMRSTQRGFWHAAILSEAREAFLAFELRKYKKFLDLGSGDGRITLLASLFVKDAEGIEGDEALHKKAQEMKQTLGIHNAAFHQGDFNETDIGPYDILFINPDTPFERGLESKLRKELRGDLIVYGAHFLPMALRLKNEIEIGGTRIFLYGSN